MIKLDFTLTKLDTVGAMQKNLRKGAVQGALERLGMTQSALAKEVGVSAQSVTNWLKGDGFPRPDKLLKLSMVLRLKFDQLVEQSEDGAPIIAFRKKGNAKTTEDHLLKAQSMAALLRHVVDYLPEISSLRFCINNPSIEYHRLQRDAAQLREKIGIGQSSTLRYQDLIKTFQETGSVLIPVLWGEKKRHENALHILLPKEDVTFVFLNLDTRLEDFKFWMAHELAHMLTPDIAGQDIGEDFADAFAGSLLFPQELAQEAYNKAIRGPEENEATILHEYAMEHRISINTVYVQVKQYAEAKDLANLRVDKNKIHSIRNGGSTKLVSQILFDPEVPSPTQYIARCENAFLSPFFGAIKRMIHDKGIGPAYLQQLMDIQLQDAVALHRELSL